MRKMLFVSVGAVLGLTVVWLGGENAGRRSGDASRNWESRRARPADWPILKRYDEQHLARIALPLGGIGTGTVSLGGRGDLRDWEIMNRPAKGFTPKGPFGPFFAIFVKDAKGKTQARGLEGPIDPSLYEDASGSSATNHGLPRFRRCTFVGGLSAGAGHAFRPGYARGCHVAGVQSARAVRPGDPAGFPSRSCGTLSATRPTSPSRCRSAATMPNFIGNDGSGQTKDYKGDLVADGKANRNEYREGQGHQRHFHVARKGSPSGHRNGAPSP